MRGLVLVLLLSACTPKTEVVVVPMPPVEDERIKSELIVFQGDDTFVYAIDLTEEPDPVVKLVARGWENTELTAVVFQYDHPLDFYRLDSGIVGAINGPRSCALKSPFAVAVYEGEEWRALDPPRHGAIGNIIDEATFGCTPNDLCRNFRIEVVELDTNRNIQLLLELDDQTALLGFPDGRLFEVTHAGGLTLRSDLAGLPVVSGMIRQNGEIWLGGVGRIARGTRAGGFVETPLGGSNTAIAAVGVRGDGADLEAIAIGIDEVEDNQTSTVTIFRLADDAWTPVGRRLEAQAVVSESHVQWVGDEAVIVFGATHSLIWNGRSVTEFEIQSTIPLFEPHMNDIAARADYGVMIAANDGFLYKMGNAADDWSPVTEAILGNGICAVAPAYEGFFFGGPDGTTNQFYPGSAVCTAQRLVASDVERIVQLGDDLLVTGGNPHSERPNTMTWLSE